MANNRKKNRIEKIIDLKQTPWEKIDREKNSTSVVYC